MTVGDTPAPLADSQRCLQVQLEPDGGNSNPVYVGDADSQPMALPVDGLRLPVDDPALLYVSGMPGEKVNYLLYI
jgi:hypothetical protein